MGLRLLKFYEFVNNQGGTQAQMRLQVMTGLTTTKAAAAPDSDENIGRFQAAVKEITGQEISV